MIKALIIDDEKLARENLRKRLQSNFPEIEIQGDCANINDAYAFLQQNEPDLVFLDINMPGGSGFDLLKKLNKISFEIVFVTAYDQFAIKAFEFNALGYLLKPIHPERFNDIVKKCLDRIDTQKQNGIYKHILSNFNQHNPQKLILNINNQSGINFIKLEDVVYLGADGRYTTFYLKKEDSILSSQNLAHYWSILSDKGFYQVHKSFIVNLNHIQKYDNEGFLKMRGDFTVPVSRRKKSDFINFLAQR